MRKKGHLGQRVLAAVWHKMDANKKDAQWRQSLQVSVVSPACVDAQFSHTQTAHQWGILSVTFVSGHSHGSLTWELVKASTKQIHKYLQWSICFGCVMSCLVCCNETACGVGIHFSVLRVKSYFQLLLGMCLAFTFVLCVGALCKLAVLWYVCLVWNCVQQKNVFFVWTDLT